MNWQAFVKELFFNHPNLFSQVKTHASAGSDTHEHGALEDLTHYHHDHATSAVHDCRSQYRTLMIESHVSFHDQTLLM